MRFHTKGPGVRYAASVIEHPRGGAKRGQADRCRLVAAAPLAPVAQKASHMVEQARGDNRGHGDKDRRRH